MKNSKEHAFLYDLYVVPDWNERFAGLVDEHAELPKEGRILYVEAGTGGHSLELAERAGDKVDVTATDSDSERINLANAKVQTVKTVATEFQQAQPEALPFDDAGFDLVVANLSLISALAPERLPEIIAELARVTRNGGGKLALAITTRSSFGEFFSLYWEALASLEDPTPATEVETLINQLPAIDDIERLLADADFTDIQPHTNREDFIFTDAEAFFTSPLTDGFLLDRWLELLPDETSRAQVRANLTKLIDDEREAGSWMMSIKATLITGTKS